MLTEWFNNDEKVDHSCFLEKDIKKKKERNARTSKRKKKEENKGRMGLYRMMDE